MKILIDIVHPADVNFYKRAIEKLQKKHEVVFTVLKRGKLLEIVKREYPNIRTIPLGAHRQTKITKMLGLVFRELQFVALFMKEKFDKVSSFGFYPAIAAKFFRIPSVLFYDDLEYKLNFNLCKRFGDTFVIPSTIPVRAKNIKTYKGFKELAYVAALRPQASALKKYNLSEEKYVFVRDIAAVSLNYQDAQDIDYTDTFAFLRSKGYRILYFPEREENEEKYKKYCTIVKGSIPNIHSLLYYATAIISSGDTIAREAALMGVPTIYTGKRDMSVNRPIVDAGLMMLAENKEQVKKKVQAILKKNTKKQLREIIAEKIKTEWENPTAVIEKELSK